MDGLAIARHDPHQPTRTADHVLLPPAGRVEAIVTGPAATKPARLVSRCVDTGPQGDPNPAMIRADMVPQSASQATPRIPQSSLKPHVTSLDLTTEEKVSPRFTAIFT